MMDPELRPHDVHVVCTDLLGNSSFGLSCGSGEPARTCLLHILKAFVLQQKQVHFHS